MSALSLRLPDSIHRHVNELAHKEGVSINQFIASAAEKVSAIATEDYLLARAERANLAEFNAILAKVPQRPPYLKTHCERLANRFGLLNLTLYEEIKHLDFLGLPVNENDSHPFY